MKRVLLSAVVLIGALLPTAAVAQSPATGAPTAVCVQIQTTPGAGTQADPSRYPDALTWLGIALPANAIATADVIACPGAGPAASGAPVTPAADQGCAINNQGHDASITFMGTGATAMCAAYSRANGAWVEYTDVPKGNVVCTGDYQGMYWFVTDSGRQQIGKDACAGLNQYANGGTLTIP